MDRVGDLLIRIKNGYMASRAEVRGSNSKLAWAICELLKQEGYISDCKIEDREIIITLRYTNRAAVLTDVKRVSKPSRRIYKPSKALPRVLNGMGMAIVSTPKGVMTDKEARKQGLGGEVMAFVW